MMTLVLVLAIVTLLFWSAVTLDVLLGLRRIGRLDRSCMLDVAEYPRLSVIIAARNEARKIDRSLHSLVELDYPGIEIIFVDDRSSDGTSAVAAKYIERGVTSIRIEDLPPEWLGKNHALYKGYLVSSGSLLLFTDADVVYDRSALKTAVGYFMRQKADHLAASPLITGSSFLLRGFIHYFLLSFSIFYRPWSAMNDRSRKGGMGVGAFNLISREAYERIGTHKAFRLRPDDDLQLGLRSKRSGLRQRFVIATEYIEVAWYDSLSEAVRGLEKNSYAGMRYSFVRAVAALAGQFVFFFFPYTALFIFQGTPVYLFIGAAILGMISHISVTKTYTGKVELDFLFLPLFALLFMYTFTRAVALTISRGGIRWRDTFYPIRKLRSDPG